MCTAHFLSTLTCNQRENLAEVLKKTCQTTIKHHAEQTSEDDRKPPAKRSKSEERLKVDVMTTKQQFRKQVFEGKHALMSNLPHPEVHTCGPHAYILPSEAIADFVAHGLHV